MSKRRILLTAGLPYANGFIHLGHLVEYLQADFWTRFQKMQGHECHYICGDDTHGTAIMIEAGKRKITPEQLIQQVWNEHTQDFKEFQIDFSHYSSTNSSENQKWCEYFYSQMKAQSLISVRPVEQMYCEHDKMFLPDRFVKGTCPKCGALDQYGDNCDVCGATYSPSELKSAYCSVCSNKPVLKTSEHLMFQLEKFREYLSTWLIQHTSPEVHNKMKEWFNEPLRDWDISRDGPYFGFRIPGYDNKYFYVWVDAPMGYVSATAEFCQKHKLNFDDFWRSDKTEIYHFIGKDITYFHTLFWPALLKTAGLRTPNRVFVHGRLMINGEKMSKSKGTMIPARVYLKHLDPTFLRYYYASKLNSSLDDFDWSEDDFVNRVNSDLIGKITNLGSRGAQMLNKQFASQLCDLDDEGKTLVLTAQTKAPNIAAAYESREFSKAIQEIRALADLGNRYFDDKAPWKLAKTDPKLTQSVLSSTLNLFRIISIYLKPILPVYAQQVERLMNESDYQWADSQKILTRGGIQNYAHLANRVDPEKVKSILTESKAMSQTQPPTLSQPADKSTTTPSHEIEFDDFAKVDLRVAKVIEAEEIAEADKLLRLKVDLGPLGQRQIIAGIKSAYKAEGLVGRHLIVVANLKPRKMKFGISEGMVLAAGEGGANLFVTSPDSGAKPGDKVK